MPSRGSVTIPNPGDVSGRTGVTVRRRGFYRNRFSYSMLSTFPRSGCTMAARIGRAKTSAGLRNWAMGRFGPGGIIRWHTISFPD